MKQRKRVAAASSRCSRALALQAGTSKLPVTSGHGGSCQASGGVKVPDAQHVLEQLGSVDDTRRGNRSGGKTSEMVHCLVLLSPLKI